MTPRNAATAPRMPRSWSPTRMLTLVELRPGSVCPISSAARNSSSLTQRRRPTSMSRRYATMPPPKLTEPITRNVEKMAPRPGRGRTAPSPPASLMVVRRLLPQAVHDRRLGDAEREPRVRRVLQAHEEVVGVLARLLVQLLVAREAHLIAELRDRRGTDRMGTPHGQVGLGLDAVPEVEHADRLHDLGHARLLDDLERRPRVLEYGAQRREHLERVRDVRVEMLARSDQDTAVREQAPDPAGTVARRQQLLLELDAIGALGRGPQVDGRRRVEVLMAELDRELGVGGRPPVTVRRAAAHDERRLVEREAGRVVEQDLEQPVVRRLGRVHDTDAVLVRRVAHQLAERL